jgi:hypothetical protein
MMAALMEDMFHQLKDHAARLTNDVELAATREDHIRLSARANEADNLAQLAQKIMTHIA